LFYECARSLSQEMQAVNLYVFYLTSINQLHSAFVVTLKVDK